MTPEEIVRGMTEAQKRALFAFCERANNPWGYFASDLGVSPAACAALARKGLLMGGLFPGDRATAYRWTEKGDQVRTYLESKEGERG